MIVLQTIAVAFAMFSAVPVPQFAWNEKNMRYALCAFPLVGLLCGALWCVCGVLPLPAPARAAGFCLVPVWVTGGIHLDATPTPVTPLPATVTGKRSWRSSKTPTAVPLRSSGCAVILRLISALPPACSSPSGGCAVDAGTGFGAGVLRPCGGGLSHGKKHRPCPYLCLRCRPHRCAQCAGSAGDTALRGAAGFRRRSTGGSCNLAVFVVSPCSCAAAGRHYRRSCRVVFAKD